MTHKSFQGDVRYSQILSDFVIGRDHIGSYIARRVSSCSGISSSDHRGGLASALSPPESSQWAPPCSVSYRFHATGFSPLSGVGISSRRRRPVYTLQTKGTPSLTSCPSNTLPSVEKRHFVYRSAAVRLHVACACDVIAASQIFDDLDWWLRSVGRVEGKK
jgi:hypothetical protein